MPAQITSLSIKMSCEMHSPQMCFPSFQGSDQLSKQPAAAWPSEGFRPALQHGPGGRQGDVDREPQDWQGQEEVQASQQGQVHLKDVPEGGLSHPCTQEPTGGSGRQGVTCGARTQPLLPSVTCLSSCTPKTMFCKTNLLS